MLALSQLCSKGMLRRMPMKKERQDRDLGDFVIVRGAHEQKGEWNGATTLAKTVPEVSSLLAQARAKRDKEGFKENREITDGEPEGRAWRVSLIHTTIPASNSACHFFHM